MYDQLAETKKWKLTYAVLRVPGVPQGFNPPEKLGRFRQMIERMLQDAQILRLKFDPLSKDDTDTQVECCRTEQGNISQVNVKQEALVSHVILVGLH
jgi:hypothetical protein